MKKLIQRTTLLFFSVFLAQGLIAQTFVSVPIGQVLDSMAGASNGMTMVDGTRIQVYKIALGTADNDPDFGRWNQYQFGGIFNGNPDENVTTPATPGITLDEYNGSRNPTKFTRIAAAPSSVDGGDNSDYANAIGYRIHFSEPIPIQQVLLLDGDGKQGQNAEWFSCFAYNGNNAVTAQYRYANATQLTNAGNTIVADSWTTKVLQAIPGAGSFNRKRLVWNTYTGSNDDFDPDEVSTQVIADFGTDLVDNVFVLWGIRDHVAPVAGAQQNSGLSPLVFSFSFDFGDVPDTYGTKLDADGARHVISPLIFLGNAVTADADGQPSAQANQDADDGVSTPLPRLSAGELVSFVPTFSITTSFTNNTGRQGNFAAWVDWNNNGVFNPGEGLTATTGPAVTTGNVTFTWTNKTMTRALITDNYTFARIRFSTADITTSNPKGTFKDGEVEDYRIPIDTYVLPLDLISFNANASNNKALLRWVVNNQVDVQKYIIMHSTNAADFTAIGAIMPNSLNSNFTFTHQTPAGGKNFYYLKIADKNGYFSYSRTVLVNMPAINKRIRVYPNPAASLVNISIKGYNGETLLKVYNGGGQQVITKKLKTGDNIIDVSLMANGNYIFSLSTQGVEISSSDVLITH
jgi:hypothetical protein